MAKCSKCGDEAMTFTCKYCGEKFCSKHRLPEKHQCEGLEEGVEKKSEETGDGKWFQKKEVKNPAPSMQKSSQNYRKPTAFNELKRLFSQNYTLVIILFTSIIFLLQMLMRGFVGEGAFYELFVLQPGLENVLRQPWSLVTVMFLHGGLFHLFANMVTFYFFGTALERVIGSKELLKFYFGAGIIASLGFVIFRNLLYLIHGPCLDGATTVAQCAPGSLTLGPAVGASGAVIAAFAAVAMLYPKAEVLLYFFIPMKISTALQLFGAFEVFNLLAKAAGITLPLVGGFASSAHLTGLVIGFWYGKKIREKRNQNVSTIDLLGY